ncbi:MAG: helix-turn-helix domain-containing protein [Planctomycetes bacterium]|nr:helix-turn-helix domain-containing protein [Planctomycetota bacterium]
MARSARTRTPRGARKPAAPVWDAAVRKALGAPPWIVRAETLAVGDIWGARFHTTPSHELIHVLQGHATIEDRRGSVRVGPGDTFVIPRGTLHKDVREQGPDYRVLYVFFHWPGGEKLIRELVPFRLASLPGGAKQRLHATMKELEDEYLGDAPGATARMQMLLLEALLALTRHAQKARQARPVSGARQRAAQARRSRSMADVRAYLEAHYAEEIGLEALAERFSLSPFNLSRSFSQEFGRSLVELLTTIRMERAQEFFAQGLSVKEAAARVGYANGNYFAKVFRRVTGRSPSEYLAALAAKK